MNVAWFITPHGFGHTTRSVAIMAAMQRIRPVRFEIFSSVPEFLFDGIKDLRFHDHVCDVGLVQKSSIEVDLPATVTALDRFLADHESAVIQLATTLQDLAVSLVVCDISPIGIAAAKRAGLPVVLVENFTWDWIYEGYLDQEAPPYPLYRLLSRSVRHGRCSPADGSNLLRQTAGNRDRCGITRK